MARKRGNFEEEMKKLIKSVTGFDEEEENFDLCKQFIDSNFKHHRYLGVDSHKIKRAAEGIHEKLVIHSYQDKANTFKSLVDNFLESSVFEDEDKGHTDTHFSILSLLLGLADAPTEAVYRETKRDNPKEKVAEFDWAGYLLDGEYVYDSTFSESDLSDFSDEEEYKDDNRAVDKRKKHVHGFSLLPQSDKKESPVQVTLGADLDEPLDEQTWLERHLVVNYWKYGISREEISTHASSNVSFQWENYMMASDQQYASGEKNLLTEYHIIREILWMLSGIKVSHVYMYKEDRFVVKPNIQLSHLTQGAVSNTLQFFGCYGDIMVTLNDFVESVINISFHGNSSGHHESKKRSCQTYEAFAASLFSYLQKTKNDLCLIETQVNKQDETWTLSLLQEKLQSLFDELRTLHHIYKTGVSPYRENTDAHVQASMLLSTLYDTVMHSDTLGLHQPHIPVLLLRLWIETSKPYWDIVDNWIYNGFLTDPHREFIIQRNTSVQTLDENFWATAFTIHVPASTTRGTKSAEKKPDASAPGFLTPVLEPVILAGKSMEMIQSLGKLAQVVPAGQKNDDRRKTLYEDFIANLQEHLHQTTDAEERTMSPEDQVNTSTPEQTNVFTKNIERQMRIKGIYDPLLKLNFAAIFSPVKVHRDTRVEHNNKLESAVSSLELSSLSPVDLMLERCLYPAIHSRYKHVSQVLLQILRKDYQLRHYFDSVRSFFLLEAGDAMYDFYMEIFTKLRYHEPWKDIYYLNTLLHEALSPSHPQDAERLYLTVEETSDSVQQPVSAIDGVTLHFKVPWPVDVLLNSRCMKIYNGIFRFLLQIKRAKYSLDELKFVELEVHSDYQAGGASSLFLNYTLSDGAPDRDHVIHRMQILRTKLMHSVNSLHTYLMTVILHSTGLEFQRRLEEAEDLDQVILAHMAYLKSIHEQCLLHKPVAFVKQAIMKLLGLALTFQRLWDDGITNENVRLLSELESEHNSCLKFLSSILNNIIKRGSYPFLESLAFFLISSNEHCKR